MIKFLEKIKGMKGKHLYLKAFSNHYKKSMIIRLLFLSYPYKIGHSAKLPSMDLKNNLPHEIHFDFNGLLMQTNFS